MGYYIQVPEHKNKAGQLQFMYNAMRIPQPMSFGRVPASKALICVINNGRFEAAGYIYNEREFKEMNNPDDRRDRVWLLMDKQLVHKLVGFTTNAEVR